jgi:DNA-binding NarL/FixJ family response regulator
MPFNSINNRPGAVREKHRDITVAILDNNPLLREGLASLFNHENGFRCIALWKSCAEAMEGLPELNPDIFLLDIKMPEIDGFDFVRKLCACNEKTKVIITVDCAEEKCIILNPSLSAASRTPQNASPPISESFTAPDDCLQIALKIGAHGVLRKQCSFKYIIQAVKTVNAGQYWMELPTANRLAQQYLLSIQPSQSHKPVEKRNLTLRERQIVYLIAQGRSNKEISRELVLSYSTVKNYVSSILEKLSLSDRTQIALYAVDIPLSSPS